MIKPIRALSAALVLGLAGLLGGGATLAALSDLIQETVLSQDRPSEDRQQDGNRKPVEILEFLGAEPGDVVLDVRAGNGYYTELLSRIVGPEGKVYAHLSDFGYERTGEALRERAERLGNVEVVVGTLNEVDIEPLSVDRVLMSQVLHDMFNLDDDVFMANRRFLYDVMQPNGRLVVIDHAAPEGTGDEHTSDLHRVEARAAAQAITQAGLHYDARIDALANADDDRQEPAFALDGRSDRFVQRFIKAPRSR